MKIYYQSKEIKRKCVNTGCKHLFTVNIKNGKVFGQCVVCSNFESLHCAGTNAILKLDINYILLYSLSSRYHSIPVFPKIETETPEEEDEQIELEEICFVIVKINL